MTTDARFSFGALPRPADPRELRYRLLVPPTANLREDRSLARYRSPVETQQFGSCTGHAVTSACEMLATRAGLTPPGLGPYDLYYQARLRRGWQNQDSGAYLGDACDAAIEPGVSRASLWPNPFDYRTPPTAAVIADRPQQDYALAHQAFYPTDPGGLVAGIWTALDEGKPVVIGMHWHQDFFTPVHGVLPIRIPGAGVVGGHAVVVWGWQARTGLVWCRNSWGAGWYQGDIRITNPEADPGDFAIPVELFNNGIVWEARALSPERIAPPPVSTGTAFAQIWTGNRMSATGWDIASVEVEISPGATYMIGKHALPGKPEETDIPFVQLPV